MQFVNPLFLVGSLSALLPLLIHLLTRDRVRKVEFSTLRFFAKNSQRVLRRKRWQEALLLATRMLVCALLGMAFARPFLVDKSKENLGNAARTARVILVDVSGSMARSTTPDKLKAACQKALGELSEGTDAAALITFADAPEILADLSQKFDAIKSKIDTVTPGQGGTNMPAALQAADDLLKNTHARNKEILLVSDLQRSGWAGTSRSPTDRKDWKLSPDVKLVVQSLAPSDGILPHADLAIIDSYCPESVVLDQAPQSISVKIANRSAVQRNDVAVTLLVNGKQVATQKVNLREKSSMLVQFAHVFETPGDNAVIVHLGADEANTPETTAYFNARAIGKIPVVILNGAPSANHAIDAGFFLNLALSPKQSPPFDVRTIDVAQAKPDDIKNAAVVFISDTDKLPSGLNQGLADLLQRGGGLMFLPGEKVSAQTFNTQFGGTDPSTDLAPCRLKAVLQIQPVPGEIGGISLARIDFDHPIFRPFSQPHHGDFSSVRFFRMWDLRDYQGISSTDTDESHRPTVLARFDDGRPALLERHIGRGISLLLAASTDLRWSNFPEKAAVFQPFLHLAAKYLSIRTEPKTAFRVGDTLPVPEGSQLKDPHNKIVDNPRASEAGLYTLIDKSQTPEFCYAVNTDPAETDVATVTPDELIAAVQHSQEEAAGPVAAAANTPDEQDGRKIWWYLTLALAALFTLELFLANHTLRH